MKKYNCALCNTPVTVLDGMRETTCSKCGNIIKLGASGSRGRSRFKLPWRAMLLVVLLAALVGIWVYIGVGRSSGEAPGGSSAPAFGQSDSISTDNYANANLDYFYYIPPKVQKNKGKSYPLLVMVPGQSGRGEDFVTEEFKEFADEEGFVIISPSFMFDENNWASQRSYQYPAVWSGDALLTIVDQVEEKNGIAFSKFYMFGFSAGAQYSARFCLWRPDLCAACAANGFGSAVIPTVYVNVKYFVSVGDQDTSRIDIVKGFYNAAVKLGIDVTYREYSEGHALCAAQINDDLEFFKGVK